MLKAMVIFAGAAIWFQSGMAQATSPQSTRFFPLHVDEDSFKVTKVTNGAISGLAQITLSFTIKPMTTCQAQYAGLFQNGVYNPNFTVVYERQGPQQCGHTATEKTVSHDLWINMGTTETPLSINNIDYLLRKSSSGSIEIVKVPR
jgi:hypothetical protein